MLHIPVHLGQGSKHRIVLVHGFTQAGGVWERLAQQLAQAGYEVIAPDLPGHGWTDAKHDPADLWEAGRLLGEAGGKATYVGYSLGGRALLHTALHADLSSDLVERMVIIGAKAGFRNPADAATRTRADNALADRIEALGRDGKLDVFIDEWLQHPVNIRLPHDATHRALRLRNRPEGLAASLRYCGSGPQQPLWEKLPSLQMPVLVGYAEHDTPVILEDNAGLAQAIGANAQQYQFRGVGHSIPFEAPAAFAEVVLDFARGVWPAEVSADRGDGLGLCD